MIYKNYREIADDVAVWCQSLRGEDITGVCGVPRAGSLIAYLISAHLNIQLVEFSDLLSGSGNWRNGRRRKCAGATGKILVVDDTVATGDHMRDVRAKLANCPAELVFGAYIAMTQGKSEVDCFYLDVGNEDHLFEFNIFHHWFCDRIMSDLDGVLSEDWTHDHETGDLEQTYHCHLQNSRWLIRPTFQLKAIVTGRLEIHRSATESWLRQHNIQFGELIMHPATRPEDRHDVALWKGDIFKQSNAMMFVESCPVQAARIKEVSCRDCLD